MSEPKYHDRPLVYVAGPYAHPDPVANTHQTIKVAEELLTLGVTPVIPHLSMLWHAVVPHPVDFWYAYDLAILARCDAVYRIEGASTGADDEEAFAESRGIPVFHSVPELDLWLRYP